MANITKTVQTELRVITAVAANAVDKTAAFPVSTHLAAQIGIDFAPDGTGAAVGRGTFFEVQVSSKASGDDTWRTVQSFETALTAANSSAVDLTEAAGDTLIEEATTTGLAVGQTVFFKNTTLGNSEWGVIVAFVASTSFTLRDGLTNAQTGSTWFNLGERYSCYLDLTAIQRIRVTCNNNLGTTNRAITWRVSLVTGDSIA